MKLQGYQFTVQHIEGEKNTLADYLSRMATNFQGKKQKQNPDDSNCQL